MNRVLAAALLGLLSASASAQQVLPGGLITFTSKQMGVPVDGQFKQWTAQIQFDPKKPEAGKVVLSLNMGSASLGVPETDAELAKPDWFHVARFPQATFTSSSIQAEGKGRLLVKGQLAIKGQSQAISVPVQLSQSGSGPQLVTTASGQLPLKRLAFKVGEGPWGDTSMVADEVIVKFNLKLSGIAPL